MRWLSRLVTVAIFAAVGVLIVVTLVRVSTPETVGGRFATSALFRDASGLPIGSRVVIAGVTVGQIDQLAIEGNLARVRMRLVDDVVVWDDAFATKKASSALGDNYIEISPGGPDPDDPGDTRVRRRLVSGEPIPRVIEATTTDRVMRSIEKALPRLDDGMGAADAFLDEGREWVSGDFAVRLAALDKRLAEGGIVDPLHEVQRAAVRFDERTAELAGNVAADAPGVARRLDTLPRDVATFTGDLRSARAELAESMAGARASLDDADPYLDRAAELVDELGDSPRARGGTLAKLVNDHETGDDLADALEGLEEATGALDRVKTTFGFRVEMNLISRQPRFYVTAELAARNDQFYYIEAEKGPTGDNPSVTLTEIPGAPDFQRRTEIPENLRFTAQWGRRFQGDLAVRLGIKESQFGAGIDAMMLGGRLKLSLDAMESNFSHAPRIKLGAALAVFRELYILGGVDDALTTSGYLPVQPWPNEDVPLQFEEIRYGRDYYLGFQLRFHDQDINRILMIYGALITTMLL